MKVFKLILIILLLLPATVFSERISFLIMGSDSFVVDKALKNLKKPNKIEIEFFNHTDLKKKKAQDYIEKSEVIIVDVMIKELNEYLLKKVNLKAKKVYSLRGSRDDEFLKKRGFIFDSKISLYYKHLVCDNVQNMLLFVIKKAFNMNVAFKKPVLFSNPSIYHPEAPKIFTEFNEYISWYKGQPSFKKNNPFIGITFFSSFMMDGQRKKTSDIIKKLEKNGFNVIPAFGTDELVLKNYFYDSKIERSRVDLIMAFSLKFYSSLNDRIKILLDKVNAPVFNAIHLYSRDIDEWRKDPVGIPPNEVVWTMANPEISGVIEPTPITGNIKIKNNDGRELIVHEIIPENLDHIIERLKGWVNLKQKDNSKKKVAILYYNHSQGKQNVGASYLNVFKSINTILTSMEKSGYQVEGRAKLSYDGIKGSILRTGRNIGSWAPGELDKMLSNKSAIKLPIKTYKAWFKKLPEEFQKKVVKQWGQAESCGIMVKGGNFIIPGVIYGNTVILPEPSRGWSDEPMKLYHDPYLYPHHQYIAAYLWIKNVFRCDAMIHLGTHATYEWLPGKQAGLTPSCPPEIMTTDIPNLYPYIVDDVGEGLQAKRRGRAVIIDHMIPPLKKGGLYKEYLKLYEMINVYNSSVSVGSKTSGKKLDKIKRESEKLGILKELNIKDINVGTLEKIGHYLLELKENLMPFGMHTFGEGPSKDSVNETVDAIHENNKNTFVKEIRKRVKVSAENEIRRLIKGLSGGFIPAGEGNDPVRNINSIPTGKNFYGFSPDRIPSKTAWELGKKAAIEIIEKNLKDKGHYPNKVALVLWATETLRNEGINECSALFLMGIKPVWDKIGRVKGIEVIPGIELKRPRIDVLINPSGLYRDLFPQKMLFLDRALKMAHLQDDIENFLRNNNEKIRKQLVNTGMDKNKAEKFSRLRIFSEKPGAYGTGVSELASASGFWQSDDEIAKLYENKVGFAFGEDTWGVDAKDLLKKNLKNVDVAVHSSSSALYGLMDNDDFFQYLGGLSMAVRKNSGKSPETFVTRNKNSKKLAVEGVSKAIGRELRTRYLNPKWIKGMKKEDYAGAREMSKFVEYMWGWQVTVPDSVDKKRWDMTYDVYVHDQYKLKMKEFFNKANPWAYQSITARMLEAVRKDYYKADKKRTQKLAVEYAVNVVEKGVACCDHTCNNPVLNQMVVNIISLPGVLSPEIVEKFKIAIEKTAKVSLEKQLEKRAELQKNLLEGFNKNTPDKKDKKQSKKMKDEGKAKELKTVEGYKMEEIKSTDEESRLTSSGIQWFASVFTLLVILTVTFGALKRKG